MKKIALYVNERNIVVATDATGRPTLPTEGEVRPLLPPDVKLLPVETRIGNILTATVPDWADSPTLRQTELRPLYGQMQTDVFAAACKAKQILYWDSHSRFCPCCGAATEPLTDIAKKCPQCGFEIYPTIAPAIIVRIERTVERDNVRHNEILMVRAHNFRGDHYGLVAGFLESGETFEECVAREVMEETGLTIKNIRYFGNQSWPFPSGQMIGFTADYADGEIRIQKEELADAQFFGPDNMPVLPSEMSIARRLVDDWLEKNK